MAYFNNIIGKTIDEKTDDLFNKTNQLLRDSKLLTLNPGYLPASDILEDDDLLFKYDNTLHLKALEGIDTDNKIILDIACGRGGAVSVYKKYFNFNKIYGIDINKSFIEFCKNKYKDIDFDLMDMNNLNYKKNFFDIITISDSIFHCKERLKFFNSIKKILKPGGVFIMMDEQLDSLSLQKLSFVFDSIEVTDITKNIVDSCEDIIKNVGSYSISEEEKTYILYCSNENYLHYKKSESKFLKTVCRKAI